MSKAQGTPLSTYDWPWFTGITPPNLSTTKSQLLSDAGKKIIMRQLGEIVYELSRLRLDKIGSLFEETNGYVVEECLAPGFVWRGRDSLDIDRSPFDRELAYYESLISATKMHAQELPMETHLFSAPIPTPSEFSNWTSYQTAADRWNDFAKVGGKIDSGKNRLDYCILSGLVKEMIPKFTRDTPSSGGFPIRHPDLSVNNIFVDDDLRITCIIDWGFVSSVPFAELLAVPGMPYPRCQSGPSLVAAFEDGFEGKGGHVDPQLWEDAEKLWHFQRLVFIDSLQNYPHFEELYNLVYKADQPIDIGALFRQQYALESNQKELVLLSEEDQCVADIEREEREYFSHRRFLGSIREAVARKLTVMAELNPAMVADRRLWHWIEAMFDGAQAGDKGHK